MIILGMGWLRIKVSVITNIYNIMLKNLRGRGGKCSFWAEEGDVIDDNLFLNSLFLTDVRHSFPKSTYYNR